MSRYIVDSYLYRAIGADINGGCGRCVQSRSDCMYHSLSRMDICWIIDDAPTADVVEVVRCKDCRFHEDEQIGMVYCPAVVGGWVEDNWFCKGGERKDE